MGTMVLALSALGGMIIGAAITLASFWFGFREGRRFEHQVKGITDIYLGPSAVHSPRPWPPPGSIRPN
jgi:hypothetical protein